jgi:Uma2 family endonuclease
VAGLPKSKGRFNYDDYAEWPEAERWELIGGEAFAMPPAPTIRHQRLVRKLALALSPFFQGKPCELFISPVDVKLSVKDVVQPDLLVVCDPKQVKSQFIQDAPKLIVEILSPGTEWHDRGRKLELYATSGVLEYWLVSPFPSYIEVLTLDRETYKIAGVYGRNDTLKSPGFPELTVNLAEVFDFNLTASEKKIFEVRESAGPEYQSPVDL